MFKTNLTEDYDVHFAASPSKLSGTGLEYLVINGQVIARFFNGNFLPYPDKGNGDDPTIGVL